MIVSIHQPNYLPWLGFWHKLFNSDLMILLDVVQFEKNEFQNRQKIKLSNGQPSWLSVPVHHKYPQAISTIKIDNSSNGSWVRKHLHALRFNYEKTGWWKKYGGEIEAIYRQHSKSFLVKLNTELIEWIALKLGCDTKLVLASDLLGRDEDLNSDPTDRIVDLCKIVKADTYLTGKGAMDYLCKEAFTEAELELKVQRFEHPLYPQLYGQFLPNLSVMDLLLNVGGQAAGREIVNPGMSIDGIVGAES